MFRGLAGFLGRVDIGGDGHAEFRADFGEQGAAIFAANAAIRGDGAAVGPRTTEVGGAHLAASTQDSPRAMQPPMIMRSCPSGGVSPRSSRPLLVEFSLRLGIFGGATKQKNKPKNYFRIHLIFTILIRLWKSYIFLKILFSSY